jgi:hypothetical protein
MTKRMMMVLIAMMSVFALAACGDDGDEGEFLSETILGQVGGCQVENKAQNLRVGVMGQTEDLDLIEIASVAIDTLAPKFQIKLDVEPSEEVFWVLEGDGSTQRTELFCMAYLDMDGDGAYDKDNDGNIVGAATQLIYFFDAEYTAKNAVFGYNLASEANAYDQNFSSTSFYIAAAGCVDDTATDGDQ